MKYVEKTRVSDVARLLCPKLVVVLQELFLGRGHGMLESGKEKYLGSTVFYAHFEHCVGLFLALKKYFYGSKEVAVPSAPKHGRPAKPWSASR